MNKKPIKKTTRKKSTKSKATSSTEKKEEKKEEATKPENLLPTSLDGKLLHVNIATDLSDEEEIDELHSKIEERIEKKLEENGVKNCIVFVSGPNIKLTLL